MVISLHGRIASWAVRWLSASAPVIRACSSGASRPSLVASAASPASSSAVKTVLTASVASTRHSDSIARAAHFIATSSGLVAMQNASIGGPSHRTAFSGPASVRFFGTISPTTVCSEDDDAEADHEGDRVHGVLGQPDRRERALEQVGQGRLGERAEAERADRDAELGAGDHHRDLAHRAQRRPGPPGGRRHRLDHRTPRGDQRELAGHEERVAEQQHDGDEEASHRPAPAGRRGPARSGAAPPRPR